jgi:hypothetical protein
MTEGDLVRQLSTHFGANGNLCLVVMDKELQIRTYSVLADWLCTLETAELCRPLKLSMPTYQIEEPHATERQREEKERLHEEAAQREEEKRQRKQIATQAEERQQWQREEDQRRREEATRREEERRQRESLNTTRRERQERERRP